MNSLFNLKSIEHFIVVLVVAFFAQVAIAGASIDLSSSTGRTAAVTAIGVALWRVFREDIIPTMANPGS